MKIFTNIHTKLIFKRYFIILFIINSILLILIFLIFFLIRKQEISNKISSLKSENYQLAEKLKILEELDNVNINDVENYLNNVIPNQDNIFTIISSLNELSKNSGIIISNYEIKNTNVNSDKIKIKINFITNDVLKFLEEYQKKSKRLIIITDVEIKPDQEKHTLVLNFLNYQFGTKIDFNLGTRDIKTIKQIYNKIIDENISVNKKSEELYYIDEDKIKINEDPFSL